MARNALDRSVTIRCWERAQEWNAIVQEIGPIITASLEESLQNSRIPKEFISRVKNPIRWDILFMCLEEEYRDLVEPIFFIPHLEPWYAAGHFPCGWDGKEFPSGWDGVIKSGRLIVF